MIVVVVCPDTQLSVVLTPPAFASVERLSSERIAPLAVLLGQLGHVVCVRFSFNPLSSFGLLSSRAKRRLARLSFAFPLACPLVFEQPSALGHDQSTVSSRPGSPLPRRWILGVIPGNQTQRVAELVDADELGPLFA